jgi:hypothetical protein
MIGMRVREYYRSRRNSADAVEPICSTIDHNSISVLPNKQRTMSSVLARTALNLSARTEKRQLDGAAPSYQPSWLTFMALRRDQA